LNAEANESRSVFELNCDLSTAKLALTVAAVDFPQLHSLLQPEEPDVIALWTLCPHPDFLEHRVKHLLLGLPEFVTALFSHLAQELGHLHSPLVIDDFDDHSHPGQHEGLEAQSDFRANYRGLDVFHFYFCRPKLLFLYCFMAVVRLWLVKLSLHTTHQPFPAGAEVFRELGGSFRHFFLYLEPVR
jgi:hypothetical protein